MDTARQRSILLLLVKAQNQPVGAETVHAVTDDQRRAGERFVVRHLVDPANKSTLSIDAEQLAGVGSKEDQVPHDRRAFGNRAHVLEGNLPLVTQGGQVDEIETVLDRGAEVDVIFYNQWIGIDRSGSAVVIAEIDRSAPYAGLRRIEDVELAVAAADDDAVVHERRASADHRAAHVGRPRSQ